MQVPGQLRTLVLQKRQWMVPEKALKRVPMLTVHRHMNIPMYVCTRPGLGAKRVLWDTIDK